MRTFDSITHLYCHTEQMVAVCRKLGTRAAEGVHPAAIFPLVLILMHLVCWFGSLHLWVDAPRDTANEINLSSWTQ